MENTIAFNPICLDLNMPHLDMNNTIISMLTMLQTIISTLPMNTTNIKSLTANNMNLENLSINTLSIELMPSYWVVIVLVLTITCMFLGTLMLFIKLLTSYKKYKNGKYNFY